MNQGLSTLNINASKMMLKTDQKTFCINVNELMQEADKKQLHLLAIVNGKVNCSYQEAMRELDEYTQIALLLRDGNLFGVKIRYLLNEHFNNYSKDNSGTAM